MSLYDRLNELSANDQRIVLDNATEYSERELYERFDSSLNDWYEPYEISRCLFEPADVLKNCDQTTYACWFADFTGNDDLFIEFKGHYYDAVDIERGIDAIEYKRN
jgi:hypothetical protein